MDGQAERTGQRVVVADDHVPMRRAIAAQLEEAGYVVVEQVGSGGDAVAAVLAHAPDLALLDVEMPGGGLLAAERITVEQPATVVVMLTATPGVEVTARAAGAGAAAVLDKATHLLDLGAALAAVGHRSGDDG